MEFDDYVRGKKRQRRKTNKTRSGCITCKIRRIKCDEKLPACKKCTSTGRKCDGYDTAAKPYESKKPMSSTSTLDRNARQAFAASAPSLKKLMSGGSVLLGLHNSRTLSDSPSSLPPLVIESIFSPLSSFGSHLPGRAFHYFIHRSAADLTGPLQCSIWQEHVLSVCIRSTAVQNAVVALAGFHEKFSISHSQISSEQCWRQYSIAVKSIKHLVEAATKKGPTLYPSTVTDEILIACVVLITIEILLGNISTAARHIASGFDLFQTYLFASHIKCTPLNSCNHNSVDCCKSVATSLSTVSPLTECAKSLLAVFARMDIQLLSFLPKRYHPRSLSTMSQQDHIRFETLQLAQPFPDNPPVKLYQLLRRILYWIQYFATPWKYATNQPEELHTTQEELLTSLLDWEENFQRSSVVEYYSFPWSSSSPSPSSPPTTPTTPTKIPAPETAHLLLTFHLVILKLSTALSADESIYSAQSNMHHFDSIISNASAILKQRNADQGHAPSEQYYYFSLESSVVEALYYTVIKCRNGVMRRRALELLRGAGREGLWDGTVMACCAEYIVGLEEEGGERREKATASLLFDTIGETMSEEDLMHIAELGEPVASWEDEGGGRSPR